ncbi:two-component sensor histidine kinase [Streptomyces sp. WAC 01420]|nr:two-component sensor histidine kinase [Streptomyces sp. WAC 01438]RSM87361.1 two-component sensor histidine kinase [Streptomyces sp. WAC 01420]
MNPLRPAPRTVLARWGSRVRARLPFRARLAAAIGGLFLLAGTGLLAFVVLLARYGTTQEVEGMRVTPLPSAPGAYEEVGPAPPAGRAADVPASGEGIAIQQLDWTVRAVQDTALRQMLLWSGVGLVVMALLAAATGWWLAGRALRPISAMTDTARRISDLNLHERLALTGPDDELHRLADTFDGMLDRLQKAFDSQRRFVANASHELRTPLAVQRSSLEVGLADPLPEGLAEVREDLLAANRDAEKLIAALLLLARSDRGLAETERVDLAALARQSAAEQSAQAVTEDVTVDVTVHGPPAAVDGDPVLLRHLIGNLLGNALRYNHPGGRVQLALDRRTLTVTNTGPEVPADRLDDLFEPFRRVARDRTGQQAGHGLGLSIVRSIAEAHGAALTAAPGPEGGLRIEVRFP